MKIAVLGVGLIGGSIGLAAHEHVEGAEVVGYGRNPDRLRRAVELGAIDGAAGSIAKALEGASICFACAPVGALPELVALALEAAPRDCVVSDAGSTKQQLLATVEDPRFVGGHPMAGAETAGVEHARADLFQGAVWYLTPLPHSEGLLYERLHRFVVALGARPVAVDPATHDRLVAGLRLLAPRAAHHPRPPRGGVQPPAARARQRARLPGRHPAGRPRRRSAPRRPQLQGHDPRS